MIRQVATWCVQASRRDLVLVLGGMYGGRLLAALVPGLLAALLGSVAEGSRSGVLFTGFALCIGLGAASDLRRRGTDAYFRLVDEVEALAGESATHALAQIRTLDTYESARAEELYLECTDGRNGVGRAISALLNLIVVPVGILGTSISAVMVHPIFLLGWFAAVPAVVAIKFSPRWQDPGNFARSESWSAVKSLQEATQSEAGRADTLLYPDLSWIVEYARIFRRGSRPFLRSQAVDLVVQIVADVLFLVVCLCVWSASWLVGVSPLRSVAALLVLMNMRGSLNGLLRVNPVMSRCGKAHSAFTRLQDLARAQYESVSERGVGSGIELKHVGYTYPGASSPALKMVNLSIKPGRVYALVGDNGSGKSTLCDILLGLRLPTHGEVSGGGVRSSAVRQDFQRPRLAVPYNVGLGRGGGAVQAAEIMELLQAVGFESIPGGEGPEVDGVVQEVGLSGGQAQRLAIARALAKDDFLLLVLDEAMASLDPLREQDLVESFASLAKNSPANYILLVTHRMSSALRADEVIVLQHGEVVQQGTPRDLFRVDGVFREFVRVQRGTAV